MVKDCILTKSLSQSCSSIYLLKKKQNETPSQLIQQSHSGMQPYQITEEVLDLEVKVSKHLKRASAKAKARRAFLTGKWVLLIYI